MNFFRKVLLTLVVVLIPVFLLMTAIRVLLLPFYTE
jgi:hypothetical protein